MLSFADLDRTFASVPGRVLAPLGQVDTGRGREQLFRNQLPELLTELANRARVASITASSALEGVIVPDKVRAAAIIAGSNARLRTRSEQELAGYRSALDYLFAQDWRPLNVNLILHLHRLLFANTPVVGGRFKDSDNLVVDRAPDGTHEVRFTPVPAAQTEFFTAELVDRYNTARASGEHHDLLLVGLFILDLLVIHPFVDGNGRVTRALTNALLDDAGYEVGRYVSIEQLIAENSDGYYEALLASTHGWHQQEHDPWPWLTYFIGIMASAYGRLEAGVRDERTTGSKQARVTEWVLQHAPTVFRIADVRTALPGISDPTIRLVLDELRTAGQVRPEGLGRGAKWVKSQT